MMRVLSWWSCGAASTVASKLVVDKYGSDALVVYCDTSSTEHLDNARFLFDVERWLGVSITKIKNAEYRDIDAVFEKEKYMAGIAGARCTVEMKKVPRFEFQRPGDIHVFGYTSEETKRIDDFEKNNPELAVEWILRDQGYSKRHCLEAIMRAGIKLPTMYLLGFDHNNCLACCKASSPHYWNQTRKYFPEVFQRRAEQSRAIGARLVRVNGKRIFLDELEPANNEKFAEDLSCGPQCGGT